MHILTNTQTHACMFAHGIHTSVIRSMICMSGANSSNTKTSSWRNHDPLFLTAEKPWRQQNRLLSGSLLDSEKPLRKTTGNDDCLQASPTSQFHWQLNCYIRNYSPPDPIFLECSPAILLPGCRYHWVNCNGSKMNENTLYKYCDICHHHYY